MSLLSYLCSEGRDHSDTEEDFSNPRYIDYMITPPTFITYNVSVVERVELDLEEVKRLVKQYMQESTPELVGEVTAQVIEYLQTNSVVSNAISEQVANALASLGVISSEELDEILT